MTISLSGIAAKAMAAVERELPSRAFRASNELRNAALEVLGGGRSGRTYRKPGGGTYQASAPGEPPAARTGTLRNSWRPTDSGNGISPCIESSVPYTWLDTGKGRIAARPYVEPIKELALPLIEAIYKEPYNI